MSQIIHYTQCPICQSKELKEIFSVKDHTVSQKNFLLVECANCSLRFTQDIPDANSIAPYYQSEDYISHSDTSKGLVNKLYRRVRNITLKKKRKLVEKQSGIKRGKLLDIGSGTGAFVNEMNAAGWEVTGLEPDDGARTVAKKQYGLELKEINLFYSLSPNSFDVITLWHVLEHVHDLTAYVDRLHSLLRENGCLIIAVPNYTAKDAKIYKENWAAYDVPRHLYHFSPQSMKFLLEKHHFRITVYKPMWYDSFYISLLSGKYKTGKTNLIPSFINGLRSNLNVIGDVKKCSSVIYIVKKDHSPN